jgi:ribonuclease III
MGSSKPAPDLETRLGYRFHDPRLLEEALTHASARGRDNQRLEFLGDSLLNLAVALLIHRERGDWEEGPMSKLRGLLVCTEALAEWAQSLDLALKQGGKGRRKLMLGQKPMADAMEALLAAVYLDVKAQKKDGLDVVIALVERRHLAAIQSAHPGLWEQRDAKTTLQERVAVLGLPPPHYELLERSGPDHAPRFLVQVQVGDRRTKASGTTLKRAEAEAARTLLKDLSKDSSESPRAFSRTV